MLTYRQDASVTEKAGTYVGGWSPHYIHPTPPVSPQIRSSPSLSLQQYLNQHGVGGYDDSVLGKTALGRLLMEKTWLRVLGHLGIPRQHLKHTHFWTLNIYMVVGQPTLPSSADVTRVTDAVYSREFKYFSVRHLIICNRA